jgi:plasmid stabilization system protein ParE
MERGVAPSSGLKPGMSWHVTLRVAAEVDLRTAKDWYDRQRPGLGDEFLISVAVALERLEEAPERFPIYYRGFRRALTAVFPYKIFFRLDGDAVIVFRILHAARDHARHLR